MKRLSSLSQTYFHADRKAETGGEIPSFFSFHLDKSLLIWYNIAVSRLCSRGSAFYADEESPGITEQGNC